MILQENNKQYAVINYARFMSTSKTVDAFNEKFPDDLPKPQSMQQNQNSQEHEFQVEQHMRATSAKIFRHFTDMSDNPYSKV